MFLPPGEVDVVAEEVGHPFLRHLTFQGLQQVSKPLKRLGLRAQPVEVDLIQRTERAKSFKYIISQTGRAK